MLLFASRMEQLLGHSGQVLAVFSMGQGLEDIVV